MTGLAAARDAVSAGRDIVVFDLEFTAWEGSQARRWTGPGEYMEIVQFGATRLDAAYDLAEGRAWRQLVRPTRNPVLSDYFIDLTGIAQDHLDAEGVSFAEALDCFAAFVDGAGLVLCNGHDAAIVRENCRLNDLETPSFLAGCRNVGPALAREAGGSGGHVASSALPDAFPGVPRLHAHDALDDARMVAAAVIHLLNR